MRHLPIAIVAGRLGDLERVRKLGLIGPEPLTAEYELDIPPVTLPAGSRLRLQLRINGFVQRFGDTLTRLLWGGEFGASGLELATGVVTP